MIYSRFHSFYFLGFFTLFVLTGCNEQELDITETIYVNKNNTGKYELEIDPTKSIKNTSELIYELDSLVSSKKSTNQKYRNRAECYSHCIDSFIIQCKERENSSDLKSMKSKANAANISDLNIKFPSKDNLSLLVNFKFKNDDWQRGYDNNSLFEKKQNRISLTYQGLNSLLLLQFFHSNSIGEAKINYHVKYIFDKNIKSKNPELNGKNTYETSRIIHSENIDSIFELKPIVFELSE